jgi:hypothetical protein
VEIRVSVSRASCSVCAMRKPLLAGRNDVLRMHWAMAGLMVVDVDVIMICKSYFGSDLLLVVLIPVVAVLLTKQTQTARFSQRFYNIYNLLGAKVKTQLNLFQEHMCVCVCVYIYIYIYIYI